jgi:hypothetical protein
MLSVDIHYNSHKPDWFSSYFTHNVPFSSQVLIAKTQEIVDYKSWNKEQFLQSEEDN